MRLKRLLFIEVILVLGLGCTLMPVTTRQGAQLGDGVESRSQGTEDDVEESGRGTSGGTDEGTRGAARASASKTDASATTATRLTPELEFAARTYARRIGIVIGIDEYEHGIPRLSSAVSDARSMAEVFRTLGFDSVHELYDSGAKRLDIVDLLRRDMPHELGPNDLLVVYFAGHGMRGGDGQFYLLPKDATSDVSQSGLSMQYLKEAALGLDGRAVLYLVDACLSGTMMRPNGDESQKLVDEFWRETRRSRVVQVITAGADEESALENRRVGLFTASLRDGLLKSRADVDRNLVITTEELGAYAEKTVIAGSGGRQHPQWGTIEGHGTIVMYDLRRVPESMQRILPRMPRELIPDIADELAAVHRLMEERRWRDAETKIRALLLSGGHPELYLLLAEVYLESGVEQHGAFKNRALVERELKEAESRQLTDDQRARLFEIRRLTRKIVRGNY